MVTALLCEVKLVLSQAKLTKYLLNKAELHCRNLQGSPLTARFLLLFPTEYIR